jgi:hypothetical protein
MVFKWFLKSCSGVKWCELFEIAEYALSSELGRRVSQESRFTNLCNSKVGCGAKLSPRLAECALPPEPGGQVSGITFYWSLLFPSFLFLRVCLYLCMHACTFVMAIVGLHHSLQPTCLHVGVWPENAQNLKCLKYVDDDDDDDDDNHDTMMMMVKMMIMIMMMAMVMMLVMVMVGLHHSWQCTS